MAIVLAGSENTRLLDLSTGQFGVFSRQQALACGLTSTQIVTRCRLGAWEIVLPTVYRPTGAPLSWEGRAVAALLWAGPQSYLSHEAAARVLGLSGFEEADVVVSTTSRPRQVDGIRVHTAKVPVSRTVRRGLLRSTGVPRTLLDIAGCCDPDLVEAALDEALRRRMVDISGLSQMMGSEGSRGRKGAALLKSLLERRDPSQRPTESQLENLTLATIRRARLPLPDQQKWIHDSRGRFARVDFMYEAQRIVIEVDSFTYHSTTRDWQRDMDRRNRLTIAGFRVYHATYWNLRDRPHLLIDWLRRVLSPPTKPRRL